MSTSLVGDECSWAAVFRLDGWLVCGWCLLARGEETLGFFLFEEASSVFFLHVDQSARGGTLVNSLLCVYGLLHRHWSKPRDRVVASWSSCPAVRDARALHHGLMMLTEHAAL